MKVIVSSKKERNSAIKIGAIAGAIAGLAGLARGFFTGIRRESAKRSNEIDAAKRELQDLKEIYAALQAAEGGKKNEDRN